MCKTGASETFVMQRRGRGWGCGAEVCLGVEVFWFNEFYCLCVWGGGNVRVWGMLMMRWSGVDIDDLHTLTSKL